MSQDFFDLTRKFHGQSKHPMSHEDFQTAFEKRLLPGLDAGKQAEGTYVQLFRTNGELRILDDAAAMFTDNPLYVLIVYMRYLIGFYDVRVSEFITTDGLENSFRLTALLGDPVFVCLLVPSVGFPPKAVSKDFATVATRLDYLQRVDSVVLELGCINDVVLIRALFHRLSEEERIDTSDATHARNQRTWIFAISRICYGRRVDLLEEFLRVGKDLYPTAFDEMYAQGTVLLDAVRDGMSPSMVDFHLRNSADCYENTDFLTAEPQPFDDYGTVDTDAIRTADRIHKAVRSWGDSRRCTWVTACLQLGLSDDEEQEDPDLEAEAEAEIEPEPEQRRGRGAGAGHGAGEEVEPRARTKLARVTEPGGRRRAAAQRFLYRHRKTKL